MKHRILLPSTGRARGTNDVFATSHVRVRRIGRMALVATGLSIALMFAVGVAGPSVGVANFPPTPPWPPWFVHAHLPAPLVWTLLGLAVLLGAVGLVSGMLAVRWGWRPNARLLICASAAAVVTLMVIPPEASADMLLYVSSGRLAVLGHSPYVMTPGQLMTSGDPIGTEAVFTHPNDPSRYGPVATAVEAATSKMGGTSIARAIFLFKLWNALIFLALVLALDQLLRSHEARRVRAHLLWSINPIMLWAVMAGGHNDILAVAAGTMSLFAAQRMGSNRWLVAGIFLGIAAAIKAPCALFGLGVAWEARRSVRALTNIVLGAVAIIIPSYLIAGRAAISATIGVGTGPPVGQSIWAAVTVVLTKVLHWHQPSAIVNSLALVTSVLLAGILLWRLPSGIPDFPAVRVSLAAVMAFLLVSPQQQPWYTVMIFPLLVLFPASRLDWIAVIFASVSAVAGMPFMLYFKIHPAWLHKSAEAAVWGIALLALTVVGAALLWLCFTNEWKAIATPSGLTEVSSNNFNA